MFLLCSGPRLLTSGDANAQRAEARSLCFRPRTRVTAPHASLRCCREWRNKLRHNCVADSNRGGTSWVPSEEDRNDQLSPYCYVVVVLGTSRPRQYPDDPSRFHF